LFNFTLRVPLNDLILYQPPALGELEQKLRSISHSEEAFRAVQAFSDGQSDTKTDDSRALVTVREVIQPWIAAWKK
jgi:hypothetical protein